uniref:Actin-related protein 8 n=1 Tax=Alexandrium monilatum TaxID=311494 RepID=A0A7S4Q439_9DINO
MAGTGDTDAKNPLLSVLKADTGSGGASPGTPASPGSSLPVPGSGGSNLLSPTTSTGHGPAKAAPTAAELLQRVGVSGSTPSTGAKWMAARTSTLPYRGLGLGSSYFIEKQAVVIDFGQAYTKVGFAMESRPRHIFASPELRTLQRQGCSLSTTAGVDQWIDILDRLLNRVFFYYLSVSPKDRRVVICDPVRVPSQFRSALVHVLFKRLSVPAVSFVADLVMPLYLTGLHSGLVIDCGHEAARVMATFAGVPIISALTAAACGGRRAHRRLGRCLHARLPEAARGPWLEEDAVLEDIAVRTGYVACTIPAANAGEPSLSLKTDKAMPFKPPGGDLLQVPPECRWEPFEVFFSAEGTDTGDPTVVDDDETLDEYCSCSSIPEAFVETIARLPTDVRSFVVQNVVVCGGCAALRGLLPRLALELHVALERDSRTAALAQRLLITPLDFPPVSAVWTGGAIFATLEGVTDYTREDYDKGQPLPDWAREGYI